MTPGPSAFLLGRQLKIVLGVAASLGLLWFLVEIRGILAPFALAFVLAYVLSPLVDQMEGRGLNRTLSILLLFCLGFGLLGLAVFLAGEPISQEVSQLTDELLREEKVDRELVIGNRGTKPVILQFNWEDDRSKPSFAMVEPEASIVVIDPRSNKVVRLRFTPPDTEPAANTLLITGGNLAAPVEVRVWGNRPPRDPREEQAADPGAERREEIRINNLVVSASALDFGLAGPSIFSGLSETARRMPPYIQRYMGEDFDPAEFVKNQGRNLIDEQLLGSATQVLGGVFSGITFLFLVPFIAFFFLREGSRITRGLIELVPNAYFELCLNLLHQINGQIGGYIRGQLLATSVVAVLAVGGLKLIGLDYSVPLGLLAGFANMIPFLGPLIGILSASLVALATGAGVEMVGKVVGLFLGIQLVDNILVQPTVVARSVEMHPLVVLFVVMVGNQLMGIVGMIIAVPLFGIVKVSAQTIYLGIKGYRSQ